MNQSHLIILTKNRVDDGVTRRRTPLFKTQSNVAKPLTLNRTFKMNQSHLIILLKNRVDDGVTRRCTPLFKTASNVAKPLT